jgi:putative ABC transport system permease protein
MLMAVIGLAIGLGGAFAVTRTLSTLLFNISPNDPMTMISVALILAAIALLACYVPARRATRVDPMEALRYE